MHSGLKMEMKLSLGNLNALINSTQLGPLGTIITRQIILVKPTYPAGIRRYVPGK